MEREEAIKIVKSHYPANKQMLNEALEFLIPELRESEDERIRKVLIDYFNRYKEQEECGVKTFYGIPTDNILAWLEKQGEKHLSEPTKDYQGSFTCWNNAHDFRPKHLQRCICYDKYMKGVYCYVYDDISKYWCTQTTEEHDPDGDNHICDYADYRVTVWMPLPETSFYSSKSLLEKQGEKTTAKNIVEIWKDMRLEVWSQASGNRHEPNYSDDSTKMFSLNDIDEIIEKISEHKSINDTDEEIVKAVKDTSILDMVEPKFKVGDWIIRSASGFKHNTYLIKEVEDYYVCEELKGRRVTFTFNDVHTNFKLWDISDAKDGDVLVDVYGNIGIFQKNDDFDWSSYCSLGSNGGFRCFAIEHELDGSHPATKEQRDTLFKAMTEAGYEWDDDKKESKLLISNGGDFESNNSKQKPTWSEEDEEYMRDVIAFLEDARDCRQNALDCIEWMKQLKERLS